MHNISKNMADKIISLRKSRAMTQDSLAKAAGLPRSTVTHLESGHGNPSLMNLIKLASALNVSVEELVAKNRPNCTHIKAKDVAFFKRDQGGCLVYKLLPDPIQGMQIERIQWQPKSVLKGSPHLSGTREYFTCLKGQITVFVEGDEFVMEEGDVLAFPGDRRHSYHNTGRGSAMALSVIVLASKQDKKIVEL
ncbi:helix-turn-helix domain-containing protein [Candidatus Nucleicultrix amoebiphila]|jgi:DNA-binding XRE family transcriptional regulator|uniref:HTH cro/C1-type domain-containing protein n=1 Tax=Candidatus Nucleicultrix amoebiphila FS5 TaxID=1414854 RepID=A0A1W6N4E9_9PROT|nr:XRE family transcriptional regulator [Candidatus Nucleicultrix amoebiphila]ARN84733.1 hypothetical protein GQ61_04830 [Candidatus Nucleicultrix amoebiphila FS5]